MYKVHKISLPITSLCSRHLISSHVEFNALRQKSLKLDFCPLMSRSLSFCEDSAYESRVKEVLELS